MGSEYRSGPILRDIKHDDEVDENNAEGSTALGESSFDITAHK